MGEDAPRYIPALRIRGLTRFYDRLMALTGDEQRKRRLVEQVAPAPNHRILDLGCGTGTLTLLLKRAAPSAWVIGLDGDPEILATARRKARDAGLDVAFQEGLAWEVPLPPASLDRVVASLVFHHLAPQTKRLTLRKSYELLRPGGELHVLDWGRPHGALGRLGFLGVQLLDGFESTADHATRRFEEMVGEAGFDPVTEMRREPLLLGMLSFSFLRAVRPG